MTCQFAIRVFVCFVWICLFAPTYAFPTVVAETFDDANNVENAGSSNSALLTSCVLCIIAVIGTVMLQPAGHRYKLPSNEANRMSDDKCQLTEEYCGNHDTSETTRSPSAKVKNEICLTLPDSFCKVDGQQSDSHLRASREDEAPLRLTPKDAALCLWDIAKKTSRGKRDDLMHRHKATIEGLVKVCESSQFTPKDSWCLQTLACALVELGFTHMEIFRTIPKQALALKSYLDAKAISLLLWALAKAGYRDSDFYYSMARESQSRLKEFNPQDLTNTAWAFSTAGVCDEELFKCIADHAIAKMDTFNAQNTANLAWAFAKLKIPHGPLFQALVKRVPFVRNGFVPQAARMTAWAFKEMQVQC